MPPDDRCPACDGPMDGDVHRSEFSPCVLDPLAELEAEYQGRRVRSDLEAMTLFLLVTMACDMLGATAILEPYETEHPELFERDTAKLSPEHLHRAETDELYRARLIDQYERHADAIAEKLAAWLRDHGLGVVTLFIPVPVPGLGLVIHRVALNHEDGPVILAA